MGPWKPRPSTLYLYVNKAKAQSNPALRAFVDFYLTDSGITQGVQQAGYVDLPSSKISQTRATWRTADIETDARVMFGREQKGRMGDVFLLDGSRVHVNTEPPIDFETPHRMPAIEVASVFSPTSPGV